MKKTLTAILLIIIIMSCSGNKKQQSIEEIKATDIAFSDMSKKEGMRLAFIEYVADSGTLLRPKSFPIVGKNDVIKQFDNFDDSSFELTWEPLFADASESGDLGYSYGKYTMNTADTTTYGTYVSIWKNVDGKWKYVLDSGNDGLGK